MKFLKSLKKNNKGFSLVELIIVIAIMAVLVGTLAPQYIRYVEKSRMAADATTLDNFMSVLEVIAATPDSGLDTAASYVVSFDNNSKAIYSESLVKSGAGLPIFSELVDIDKDYVLKSSAYKAANPTVTLAYVTGKGWKTTLSGTNLPSTVN